MGANEDELARIAAAGPFDLPELGALRNSLAALAVTMKDIAGSPGWEGLSADAAAAQIEVLSLQYLEIEGFVGDLQDQIDRANQIRTAALADFYELPSAKAPAWVHDNLEAFDFPGLPDPVDLAQGGLGIIEGFLGGLREDAAGRILAAYADALEEPKLRTNEVKRTLGDYTRGMGGEDFGGDDVPVEPGTTGSWTDGGAYRGTGYTGVEYIPPGGFRPPPGYDGPDDVEIGVDDDGTGVLPGGGGGGGGGPTGPGGPGGSGGGLPGGAGAGIGTAVAGAGALAAVRLGGGAMGVSGAAARLGTGGLLGGGSPGMGGAGMAGNGGAARGGAASGTRGAGQGLLGGGGAQGGARDDRKRKAGRGLGGHIAPRLDDEDDVVLPGDGARAGGRDDSAGSLDG